MTIWGVRFAPYTLTQTLDRIDGLIAGGGPSYFVTANLHTLAVAEGDPEMQAALQDAAFVLADGMPIVWAARLRGQRLPERVAGADLLPALCERAALKGHRLFFLGGPPEVGQLAARRLRELYPNLNIVGVESPPYRPLTECEEEDLLRCIRDARPDFLFVLFGQPKGELWIRRHLETLQVPVMAQFGGSLDFVAGRVRRAPRWVQRLGLEWVWRVSREPRRLTGRYLGDIRFLLRATGRDVRNRLRMRGW